MSDNPEITRNLLEMYGRNDRIMNLNFNLFLKLSGLRALPRASRILDCGCAMGHLMLKLKSCGFNEVSGFDAAPEMVEAAGKLTGLPVIVADALEIGNHYEKNSFDAVVISDLFHHVPSREGWEAMLEGCRTVLKENGRLVIREPYPMFLLNLLAAMSRHKFLHVGFLKARLRSFVEEDELMNYFFAHWPGAYEKLLANHGFRIVKEVDWLVHRITSCQRTAQHR